MNTKERGDALLTAYVNKDFERVKHLWCDRIGNPYEYDPAIDLHGYSNPSITDTKVSMALVEAVNATRDYEAEGREKNEINAAKRRLYSLGYREVFDEVSTLTHYEHIDTGERPLEKIDFEGEFYSTQDPRKVLESLKK